jgi:hypothetical protein
MFSAALYLLASACKEIFVPLPLILFFAGPDRFKPRIHALAPFILIAALYVGWRYSVLGALVGKYEDTTTSVFERFAEMGTFLLQLFHSSNETAAASALLAAATGVGVSQLLIGRERAPVLLFACATAAAMPLYVLAGKSLLNEPNRYLFVPWFLLSLLLGYVAGRAPIPGWARIIVAGTLVLSTITLAQDHRRAGLADEALFWEALYSRLSDLGDNEYMLLPPDRNGANVSGLAHRFAVAHAKITGQPYRPDFLVTSASALRHRLEGGADVYRFEVSCRCFAAQSTQVLIAEAMRLDEQRQRQLGMHQIEPRRLTIDLAFQDRFLTWELGPYREGSYAIFLDRVPVLRPISRSGRSFFSDRPVTVQVLYRAPEGWSALSPELTLNPDVSRRLEWAGTGVSADYRPEHLR